MLIYDPRFILLTISLILFISCTQKKEPLPLAGTSSGNSFTIPDSTWQKLNNFEHPKNKIAFLLKLCEQYSNTQATV